MNSSWATVYARLVEKGPPSISDSCQAWLRIERQLCKKSSLLALLNSPTTVKKSCYSNSLVIHGTIRIWEQIKSYIKAPKMYTDTPICNNHYFIPGINDAAFFDWKQKGICGGGAASGLQGEYGAPGLLG